MTTLTFARLRTFNVARCEEVFHAVKDWTPAEWAVAMAGECGEACNVIKKLRRVKDGTNTEKDPKTVEECRQLLRKELADLVIYADLLAAACDIDLTTAIVDKFNEVSDRMKSNYKL